MLCGRSSLFTPRFLASVGSSCSWLEWASSFYLSLLLFSDCRTSSWFSPFIFPISVRDLPSCYTVNKCDCFWRNDSDESPSVRNYSTAMFQSLHFLFLCLSLLGYVTRIISRFRMWGAQAYWKQTEKYLKCETPETVILRYIKDPGCSECSEQ